MIKYTKITKGVTFMFCKNCGKQLSENAFVCPDCGEPAASTPHVDNTATKAVENGKSAPTSVTGFTASLVSVACWVCYLALTLCGYHYLAMMGTILGVITGIVCLAGLFISIIALCGTTSGKYRAFALTGIILSACMLLGFLLLTCIVGAVF